MIELKDILKFAHENLGSYLNDSPLLNWYLLCLYEKDQIIVIKNNDEIKAIQGYFLCTDEDLPYIETGDWTLPLQYSYGDILYLALTISIPDYKGLSTKYLKEIGKQIMKLVRHRDITKIIAYDLPDKELKIWTKVFNKWIFRQGNLSLLKEGICEDNLVVAQ